MVVAATSLWALRSELATAIKAIVPNRAIDAKESRFVLHDSDKDSRGIKDMTGPSRLFEIGNFERIDSYYQGYTTEGNRYECMVDFCYYRSRKWRLAAIDDIGELLHWFGINQGSSGVDGIASRYFDYATPPEWDGSSDDPWDYLTLRLLVYTDVTFSN